MRRTVCLSVALMRMLRGRRHTYTTQNILIIHTHSVDGGGGGGGGGGAGGGGGGRSEGMIDWLTDRLTD